MRLFRALLLLGLLSMVAPVRADTESQLLSNGIRILLTPTSSSEFLAVAVFVRLPPTPNVKTTCIKELAGRALFFGSLNRSFESVRQSVRLVGGSLDVQVTPQFLAITCLTVPDKISETAYLMGEALKNAEYSAEALVRARAEIAREAKERRANPYESLRYELTQRANETPDWKPEDLARITPPEVKAYFLNRFTIGSIVISVAGRFDTAKAYRTFDNNLFELKRGMPALKRVRPFVDVQEVLVAPPHPLPVVTIPSRDSIAYALLSLPAPSVSEREYAAFLTFQALLGIGHQSRLLRHFREEQGLGYETGVTFFPHYGEPLIAQVQWDANALPQGRGLSPEQISKQLQDEATRIVVQPISESELNRARQIAIGRLDLAHERVLDKAVLLGWYEVMDTGSTLDKELADRILLVTKEDIAAVAKTYLERATLGIVQPSPAPSPSKN